MFYGRRFRYVPLATIASARVLYCTFHVILTMNRDYIKEHELASETEAVLFEILANFFVHLKFKKM